MQIFLGDYTASNIFSRFKDEDFYHVVLDIWKQALVAYQVRFDMFIG